MRHAGHKPGTHNRTTAPEGAQRGTTIMSPTSYWATAAEEMDHSDLAVVCARVFALPLRQVAFCTTASLRRALVIGSSRELRTKGWR